MKLRIAAIALIVATGAFAQTPAPSAPPVEQAAPAPPQKFYLELDPGDLQAISQAVNELPKRVADPLIMRLNAQLQAAEQARIAANKAK